MKEQDFFYPADEVTERFWIKALSVDAQKLNHTISVLKKLGYTTDVKILDNLVITDTKKNI